jgi:hypothetical protein
VNSLALQRTRKRSGLMHIISTTASVIFYVAVCGILRPACGSPACGFGSNGKFAATPKFWNTKTLRHCINLTYFYRPGIGGDFAQSAVFSHSPD